MGAHRLNLGRPRVSAVGLIQTFGMALPAQPAINHREINACPRSSKRTAVKLY